MPKRVTKPAELDRLLRAGDTLALSVCGWRLVQADREVAAEAVEALAGLRPCGDQLPGFAEGLAQTWRLDEGRAA